MKSLIELQKENPDIAPEKLADIYFEGYHKAHFDLTLLPHVSMHQLVTVASTKQEKYDELNFNIGNL